MSKFLDSTKNIIEPFLKEENYEFVDMEYVKTQMGMTLIVYVDNSTHNITINECAMLDEKITILLEQNGLLPDVLSVSSPGLDRPLKTDMDYQRNINKMVDISLYVQVFGEKKFIAQLLEYNNDNITINYKNNKYILGKKNIASIRQAVIF